MNENKKPALPEEEYCFACGKENPVGLHLDFQIENDEFRTVKTLSREYQSFTGVVHGGIITTMLDEGMGGYLYRMGEKAVTARLAVRYRKPTPVGEELHIRGWIESRRGRFIDMKAEVSLADGTITAEGTAKMAVVD